jgi:AhpD family alkylhydroperoxidase
LSPEIDQAQARSADGGIQYQQLLILEVLHTLMDKAYKDITASVSRSLVALRAGIPETTRGFSALAQAATKPGALDAKTKELIAMALSVAARCDPCLGFHAEALVKHGCTRAEFEEMLGMCVYMGGGPALMYAAHALQAFEEYGGEPAAG